MVFDLAGYLVHDLGEDVPFMLLDSLGAIDADRIASLVGYFADYSEFSWSYSSPKTRRLSTILTVSNPLSKFDSEQSS